MGEASSSVPCGTCRLCCYRQEVVRVAGDDADLCWKPVKGYAIGKSVVFILETRPDGSCVHLGSNGCTVYDRRPHICRTFDCREHYFKPASERRRLEARFSEHDMAITRRGRALVEGAKR